jgi:hypothetical protein
MTALDGDYLNHLLLQLAALREFEIKGTQLDGYKIQPEAVVSTVNISTDKETRQSLGSATGAQVEKFSPTEGKPMMDRSFKQIRSPSQSPVADWHLSYQLQGHNNLQAIINNIKQGTLHVTVGFWLDNAKVIYTSAAPRDVSAVDAFEHCIKDNKIFTSQEPDRGI